MNKPMTVGELIETLSEFDKTDPVVIVIEDGVEHLDELEEGSVLDITEAGGWSAGVGRTIRVRPR